MVLVVVIIFDAFYPSKILSYHI